VPRWRNAPEDAVIVTALYEAYLALGQQEAIAGRLDSARTAFSSATETDPTRPEAAMALERIAPYSRAIVVDGFEGPENFVETSDGESTSAYRDGAFTLTITEPGLVSGYPLSPSDAPLAGEDFAALLRVRESAGDGMVTIEARTDSTGNQWVFAIDPTRQTWEILQFDPAAEQFLPWSETYSYASVVEPGAPLESVELRVTDGFPLLFANGVDVAAAAGAALPEIGNEGSVSFGALMASEGSEPFVVSFEEVGLYELT
jgi:hypothetical protein